MNLAFIPLALGVFFAVADVLPMIKKKINTYYILSAFIFHLIMPSIVYNMSKITNWWEVSLIYLLLTLPLAIIILKETKNDAVIMIVTSIIVGALVGIIFVLL